MRRRITAIAAGLGLALTVGLLAGCTTDPIDGGGGETTGGGGGADEAVDLVVLMPSTSNNYLAEWQRGVTQFTDENGWTVKFIENNFDQSEQDVQVQQAIQNEDPDFWIYWPADANAGVASLRQLNTTDIPVIVANQPPPDDAVPFMTFYSGVNDYYNGQVSGELMTEARDVLKEKRELSSEEGNLLQIKFAPGYAAGDWRVDGFADATADAPFNILASEYSGFDNEAGYSTTSQLIAANREAGIDFVYAENDALALGAIQALTEAGYKPGEDVMVVGGTCHGDLSALENGSQYGSGFQAARWEGYYVPLTIARYIAADGAVTEGEHVEPGGDALPAATGEVFQYNYIPNDGVVFGKTEEENVAILDDTLLWGDTMRNLCTY
jgi:ABC-type sugar transport system substrate-binding protein